jgi:4a-hydroxytetrahydrobiopterin dehydratase
MPERQDDPSIDDAVAALPGWERQGEQLVRRVPSADEGQDNLVRAVMKVADELDHHPVIQRAPDELCFRLWTHSVGRITRRDVELAARIDQTLSARDEITQGWVGRVGQVGVRQ